MVHGALLLGSRSGAASTDKSNSVPRQRWLTSEGSPSSHVRRPKTSSASKRPKPLMTHSALTTSEMRKKFDPREFAPDEVALETQRRRMEELRERSLEIHNKIAAAAEERRQRDKTSVGIASVFGAAEEIAEEYRGSLFRVLEGWCHNNSIPISTEDTETALMLSGSLLDKSMPDKLCLDMAMTRLEQLSSDFGRYAGQLSLIRRVIAGCLYVDFRDSWGRTGSHQDYRSQMPYFLALEESQNRLQLAAGGTDGELLRQLQVARSVDRIVEALKGLDREQQVEICSLLKPGRAMKADSRLPAGSIGSEASGIAGGEEAGTTVSCSDSDAHEASEAGDSETDLVKMNAKLTLEVQALRKQLLLGDAHSSHSHDPTGSEGSGMGSCKNCDDMKAKLEESVANLARLEQIVVDTKKHIELELRQELRIESDEVNRIKVENRDKQTALRNSERELAHIHKECAIFRHEVIQYRDLLRKTGLDINALPQYVSKTISFDAGDKNAVGNGSLPWQMQLRVMKEDERKDVTSKLLAALSPDEQALALAQILHEFSHDERNALIMELYSTMVLGQRIAAVTALMDVLDHDLKISAISNMISSVSTGDRFKLYHEVLAGLLPKEQMSVLKESILSMEAAPQLDLVTSVLQDFEEAERENVIQVLSLDLNPARYSAMTMQILERLNEETRLALLESLLSPPEGVDFIVGTLAGSASCLLGGLARDDVMMPLTELFLMCDDNQRNLILTDLLEQEAANAVAPAEDSLEAESSSAGMPIATQSNKLMTQLQSVGLMPARMRLQILLDAVKILPKNDKVLLLADLLAAKGGDLKGDLVGDLTPVAASLLDGMTATGVVDVYSQVLKFLDKNVVDVIITMLSKAAHADKLEVLEHLLQPGVKRKILGDFSGIANVILGGVSADDAAVLLETVLPICSNADVTRMLGDLYQAIPRKNHPTLLQLLLESKRSKLDAKGDLAPLAEVILDGVSSTDAQSVIGYLFPLMEFVEKSAVSNSINEIMRNEGKARREERMTSTVLRGTAIEAIVAKVPVHVIEAIDSEGPSEPYLFGKKPSRPVMLGAMEDAARVNASKAAGRRNSIAKVRRASRAVVAAKAITKRRASMAVDTGLPSNSFSAGPDGAASPVSGAIHRLAELKGANVDLATMMNDHQAVSLTDMILSDASAKVQAKAFPLKNTLAMIGIIYSMKLEQDNVDLIANRQPVPFARFVRDYMVREYAFVHIGMRNLKNLAHSALQHIAHPRCDLFCKLAGIKSCCKELACEHVSVYQPEAAHFFIGLLSAVRDKAEKPGSALSDLMDSTLWNCKTSLVIEVMHQAFTVSNTAAAFTTLVDEIEANSFDPPATALKSAGIVAPRVNDVDAAMLTAYRLLWEAERRERVMQRAATKVQSTYRGFALRQVMRQVVEKSNARELVQAFMTHDAKGNGVYSYTQFKNLVDSITPRVPSTLATALFFDVTKASESLITMQADWSLVKGSMDAEEDEEDAIMVMGRLGAAQFANCLLRHNFFNWGKRWVVQRRKFLFQNNPPRIKAQGRVDKDGFVTASPSRSVQDIFPHSNWITATHEA